MPNIEPYNAWDSYYKNASGIWRVYYKSVIFQEFYTKNGNHKITNAGGSNYSVPLGRHLIPLPGIVHERSSARMCLYQVCIREMCSWAQKCRERPCTPMHTGEVVFVRGPEIVLLAILIALIVLAFRLVRWIMRKAKR